MEILPPLPLDLYLLQEFQAMDHDNRGYLSTRQFCDLLIFLGYDQYPETIMMKLREMDPDRDAMIRQDEYINVMNEDTELVDGTRFLRDLFKKFDKDNNGYAFKSDVIEDLKEMGVYTPAMEDKIDAMDSNQDGLISYKEFLNVYFQGKS